MLRPVMRVSVALFTAAVILLLQSLFWSNSIKPWMTGAVIGLMLGSYFRPSSALLAVAAFAPLGAVWSPLVATNRLRGAEALVLAFLAGALLRGWTLHHFRHLGQSRLNLAVLAFGMIVAISCARELWRSAAGPAALAKYVTTQYLISFRGFGEIFSGMLLLEGVVILLYAAYYCQTQPDFAVRLVRMTVMAGVAAACFNITFFVNELLETGTPGSHLMDFLSNRRWSAHIGDVNAAGSFFAMIAFMAVGMALLARTQPWKWLGAAAMTGLALRMTASRTALIATLVAAGAYAVMLALKRLASSVPRATFAAAAVLVVLVAGVLYPTADSLSAAPSVAISIRWMFLQTTWRMLEAHPLFGVGIGQFAAWSARVAPPELLAIYPRENAHNNFAQIAGELGLVGLAAFLAVLISALAPPGRAGTRSPVVLSAVAGLVVFILSWLGGHPLLVPEVAFPFWLTLGVAASAAPCPPHD